MEQISTLLQGGYAYLLIFQIVVVSSLFMLLITMILRRMKTEVAHFASMPAPAPGAAVASASSDNEEWKLKFQALDEEHQKILAGQGDQNALLEKVKFLETKLLEYEILQEEIGSLSNLKNENEKLKQELQKIQSELSNQPSALDADSVPSEKAAPAAEPEGPTVPPTPPPAAEAVPATPAEIAPVETAPPPAAATEDPGNLDGLLKEIDALTDPGATAAK